MEANVIKKQKSIRLRTRLVIIQALTFIIPSIVVVYIYFQKKVSLDSILGLLLIGILVLILGGMWMLRHIFDRIFMMRTLMKKTEQGDLSLLDFQDDIDELKDITTSFNNLIKRFSEATGELNLRTEEIAERKRIVAELLKVHEELEERVRERTVELEEANKQLQELSITDGLTGLYNHRYLMQMLKSECARSARYNRNLGFLMLDIDYFKQVNDNYGHLCGDFILNRMGQIIKDNVRSTDLVARYGGEEMAIVLNEVQLDIALKVAEKLREKIKNYDFTYNEEPIGITVSIGVAVYPGDKIQTLEELLRAADHALYRAKNEGRNKVCYYTAETYNN